jgi:DNA-binding GntR family transcriptional regulator
MKAAPTTPTPEAIASHLMAAVTRAAIDGRRTNLEELAQEVGVRRVEARSALSALDRQGLLDVMRMRPTLLGFGVGRALVARGLAPLRDEAATLARVA